MFKWIKQWAFHLFLWIFALFEILRYASQQLATPTTSGRFSYCTCWDTLVTKENAFLRKQFALKLLITNILPSPSGRTASPTVFLTVIVSPFLMISLMQRNFSSFSFNLFTLFFLLFFLLFFHCAHLFESFRFVHLYVWYIKRWATKTRNKKGVNAININFCTF